MTSLANDQGFASVLEHDLRPKGPIFSHRGKFGKPAHLVNHALLVFDGTEFTGACYESSNYLPSLIVNHGGYLINQYGLLVSYQRNSPEPGNQRFLAVVSHQRCFKALSWAVRGVNDGLEAFSYGSGGTVC